MKIKMKSRNRPISNQGGLGCFFYLRLHLHFLKENKKKVGNVNMIISIFAGELLDFSKWIVLLGKL